MSLGLYFNTLKLLDKSLFESFLRQYFITDEFVWVSNFYEFVVDNEISNQKTYISLEILADGFKYQYEVFHSSNVDLTLKKNIEIFKVLSQTSKAEILSTDDEIDPWSRVLIEPNGQTSTIDITDDDDSLVISDFFNFPFGDFRTKYKLDSLQIEQLKGLIKNVYAEIVVNYSTDGPVINGEFNRVKNNYENLKNFENHYVITPIGKNQWFDREEKSELFVTIMKKFREVVKSDLCVFPRNFMDVKNIEGGSDSEEYCILLTATEEEKIIYKQRRKTWKT